jgi:hypothetical protein
MCYFTFPSGPSECPNCGAPIAKTRKEIENIEKIELTEITERQKWTEQMEVKKARSFEDFKRIAKERNYKPAWAYIKAKARGYKT